ncbi:tripartite tricarboxylate transporter substrate binding protein [Variovorax paradoxus]|nr:tripartite tricarboxylate transporter substrate binding protein [Variovorax paradoxus]
MTIPAMNRRDACLAVAGMLAGSSASRAATDTFPSRPVTFVVPYAPGNTADQWARLVGTRLSVLWKQPVIVENKPGGGTMIGVSNVARANPDGHTLLMGSLTTAMAKLTNPSFQFDPQEVLVPVIKYVDIKMILVTNSATYAKAKNLNELLAFSKSTPGGVFLGGTGAGTALNMNAGFVLRGMGVNYSEVNYNGVNPILLALLRNDVQLYLNWPASVKARIDDGSIHVLAAFSEQRFDDFPNVQTVREASFKGFLPQLWAGVFAPKNTPRSVLDRIASDIYEVTSAPDMKERIESSFSAVIPKSNPQLFAQQIATETKLWREQLAAIGYKPQ